MTRPLIFRVLEAIAADGRLNTLDKLVLVNATKHAKPDGTGCYASNATIAIECSSTARSVIRSFEKLKSIGYVTRRRRPNNSAITTVTIPEVTAETFPEVTAETFPEVTFEHPEVTPETFGSDTDDTLTGPITDPRTTQRGTRPPAVGLVEIPTKGTPSSWWLTEDTRAKVAVEYPAVDVVAVAEDMARKIRSGARDPYTARGMRRALASWVDQESRSPTRRPAANAVDPHVGAPPAPGGEWVVDTYRRTDLERYGADARWSEYTTSIVDLPPRTAPTFAEWAQSQGVN